MWSLIIPPLVLVACLGFLVWFLSKKRSDPALQERLSALSPERSQRFLLFFSTDWSLRLLERILQRLKLFSLKVHNRFQEVSTLIRRKREAVSDAASGDEAPAADAEPLSTADDKDRFWDHWHRRHRATLEPAPPLATGEERASADAAASPVAAEEPKSFSRLTSLKRKVSALTQSEPDHYVRRKHAIVAPKKLLSEEELIDRIAKNPKDAASYEELGDYYLSGDNLEDAKACYRQVIKLLPMNREVKDKVRKLERLLIQREKHKGSGIA